MVGAHSNHKALRLRIQLSLAEVNTWLHACTGCMNSEMACRMAKDVPIRKDWNSLAVVWRQECVLATKLSDNSSCHYLLHPTTLLPSEFFLLPLPIFHNLLQQLTSSEWPHAVTISEHLIFLGKTCLQMKAFLTLCFQCGFWVIYQKYMQILGANMSGWDWVWRSESWISLPSTSMGWLAI